MFHCYTDLVQRIVETPKIRKDDERHHKIRDKASITICLMDEMIGGGISIGAVLNTAPVRITL